MHAKGNEQRARIKMAQKPDDSCRANGKGKTTKRVQRALNCVGGIRQAGVKVRIQTKKAAGGKARKAGTVGQETLHRSENYM
jgi:hypothetical protein